MFGGKDLYQHFWGKELYHIYFEVTFINRNNFHIFKVIINLSIYTSLKKQVLRCNSHQYKTAFGKIILLILIYYCLQIKVVKYYGQYLHLENQREGGCVVIVFHYRGGPIYWWRKPEYPEKTTDLSPLTDKFYHIMCIEYTSPWVGFEVTTLVAIGWLHR